MIDFLFIIPIFFSRKELVSTDDHVPIFIGIKTNLILAPHLCGSWLHLIEVREDIKNLLQGWLFSALHYESSSMLISLLVYKLCGMLARIIAEFLSSLVFIFHYIKHIFWNINKAGMGELWFSLLLTKSVTFIIYFLPFFVSLFLIFLNLHNDAVIIFNYGP